MVECKDSMDNLRTVLAPLKDQIQKLKEMKWEGMKMDLWLCGDYDFFTKMFGLSGPAGKHPCLWCDVTKEQLQTSPAGRVEPKPRTLATMQTDYDDFVNAGCDKSKAQFFNNCIEKPIWNMFDISRVVPPYLHITLGIVKKQDDLLEKQCNILDQEIAVHLKKGYDKGQTHIESKFKKFVEKSKMIKEKIAEKTEMEIEKGGDVIYEVKPQDVYDTVDKLEDVIDAMKRKRGSLPLLLGPVTANLDAVREKHKIVKRARHSRSFDGNHCHKYLEERVYSDICNSVVQMTLEMTDSRELYEKAKLIRSRFSHLNRLYAKVHKLISHRKPISKSETITQIDNAIEAYMAFYRHTFKKVSIIPKQHILESHCSWFVNFTDFSLGFLGEQGGEQIHATMEKMKRRFHGMRDDGERV